LSSDESELLKQAVEAHKAAVDNKRLPPSQEIDTDEEREAQRRRARD
jgi:hypothetical protein